MDPTARVPAKATINCDRYTDFLIRGTSVFLNDARLRRAEAKVRPNDVLNMQFTSGECTTAVFYSQV